jgi:hypothetical protein
MKVASFPIARSLAITPLPPFSPDLGTIGNQKDGDAFKQQPAEDVQKKIKENNLYM